MNRRINQSLDAELLKVLAAVAQSHLSVRSSVEERAGCSVDEPLLTLCKRGYVREHVRGKSEAGTATMYSITVKGEDALREHRKEPEIGSDHSVAGPLSSPPSEIYDGSEMRPYVGRTGSMNAFSFPSRFGNRLHHRDGSVTPVSAKE